MASHARSSRARSSGQRGGGGGVCRTQRQQGPLARRVPVIAIAATRKVARQTEACDVIARQGFCTGKPQEQLSKSHATGRRFCSSRTEAVLRPFVLPEPLERRAQAPEPIDCNDRTRRTNVAAFARSAHGPPTTGPGTPNQRKRPDGAHAMKEGTSTGTQVGLRKAPRRICGLDCPSSFGSVHIIVPQAHTW